MRIAFIQILSRPRGQSAATLRWRAACVCACLLACLVSRPAVAQTNTAEISGLVADEQGGALPGAAVAATHRVSGRTIEGVTDAGGRFFLPGLPVGAYDLTVHLDGFRAARQSNIVLVLGQRLDVTVRMAVGGVSETVTVTAAVPLLQTATSEVSEVVRNEQVVNLPLNGRQFLQLALLTDNVVVPPGGTRGAALQQAGALFSVAGQRSGHNIYLLDGVKVTDEYFNNMVVSLSPDAIEEFQHPEDPIRGGVRRQGGRARQRGDARRHEPVARKRRRVHARRSVRCPQLLRRPDEAGAAAQSAPVRRDGRRPPAPRSHVLLRQLRGAARPQVA